MSDIRDLPPELPEPPPPPQAGRRPASVTLRAQPETPDVSTLMDPATRSLADALRVTYRILQAAIVLLVAGYLLSGLQSVKEGERGLRVVFGRITGEDLAPGFHFSLPRPMGEIVRVRADAVSLELDREFWPGIRDEERTRSIEELAETFRQELDPAVDGSLLTADANIAHTTWTVKYRRERPRLAAERILPEDEARVVRAAVQRGVVRAAASVTIDELLKSTPDPSRPPEQFRALETVAREVAQKTLDDMSSGLLITELLVKQRIPPLPLWQQFARVQGSQAEANKVREEAEAERLQTLVGAAGEAAPALLARIAEYERHLGAGDAEAAAGTLAGIHALLDGRAPPGTPPVGGQVAALLSAARGYAAQIASQVRSDAGVFEAKQAAFAANPRVLVNGDWTEALRTFLNRDSVEVWWLPPGVRTLELMLNRDPAIARELEKAQQLQEARENRERREEDARRGRFEKGETGQRIQLDR